MTLDKEEHRQMLNDLMDAVSFPGKMWREVHEFRKAVMKADVAVMKAEVKDDMP